MLKNSILKKVFLIFSCLFILFVLYLFPIKEDDYKINNTTETFPQTTIYLLDNNDYVSRVNVVIKNKDKLEKIKEMIAYLTINSKQASYINEGFTPIIPENTKILSLNLNDDIIKINFSKEFYNIEESKEDKLISAIIFSLTSIEGINKVSIYIEDSILHELPHSKDKLSSTLDRSYGINKYYDLTSIKGTLSTTVYYLNKYKDYYYYTPVTMVNNANKEKIEIIINELTSKTMYQTNLISYINDSKQISYEINDELIMIKLSNELYQDLNTSNLIETVIYSINLSIKENYEIKTITYTSDDSIIRTCYIEKKNSI